MGAQHSNSPFPPLEREWHLFTQALPNPGWVLSLCEEPLVAGPASSARTGQRKAQKASPSEKRVVRINTNTSSSKSVTHTAAN